MTFTYHKFKSTTSTSSTKYYCYLTSEDEVEAFFKTFVVPDFRKTYDLLLTKVEKDKLFNGHALTFTHKVAVMEVYNMLGRNEEINYFSLLKNVVMMMSKPYLDYIKEEGGVYVGYNLITQRPSQLFKNHDKIGEEKCEGDYWASDTQEENIRVIKWDGGTHFYVKVGRDDVVDENGNQKWNTYMEAYKAALAYIKRNKK
jgi:hypothetical protein